MTHLYEGSSLIFCQAKMMVHELNYKETCIVNKAGGHSLDCNIQEIIRKYRKLKTEFIISMNLEQSSLLFLIRT